MALIKFRSMSHVTSNATMETVALFNSCRPIEKIGTFDFIEKAFVPYKDGVLTSMVRLSLANDDSIKINIAHKLEELKMDEFIENAHSEQLSLMEEIQEAGFNIVSCNNCGQMLLHRTTFLGGDEITIDCPDCGKQISPNDCADLYY